MEAAIKAQGDIVRALKAKKAPKDEVKAAVEKLLALKAQAGGAAPPAKKGGKAPQSSQSQSGCPRQKGQQGDRQGQPEAREGGEEGWRLFGAQRPAAGHSDTGLCPPERACLLSPLVLRTQLNRFVPSAPASASCLAFLIAFRSSFPLNCVREADTIIGYIQQLRQQHMRTYLPSCRSRRSGRRPRCTKWTRPRMAKGPNFLGPSLIPT